MLGDTTDKQAQQTHDLGDVKSVEGDSCIKERNEGEGEECAKSSSDEDYIIVASRKDTSHYEGFVLLADDPMLSLQVEDEGLEEAASDQGFFSDEEEVK